MIYIFIYKLILCHFLSTEVSLLSILFLVFFSLALEATSIFFLRGEPVLVLKGSSLHGISLLSTALFVSAGEVLMGARAKRGLI